MVKGSGGGRPRTNWLGRFKKASEARLLELRNAKVKWKDREQRRDSIHGIKGSGHV